MTKVAAIIVLYYPELSVLENINSYIDQLDKLFVVDNSDNVNDTLKPQIPTLINLVEFPVYLLAMWFSIKNFGINGAAFTFMAMATIDAVAMYFFANKMQHIKLHSKDYYVSLLLLLCGLILPFLFNNIYLKSVYVILFVSVFLITSWKFFLSGEEKSFIVSKLKTK